MSLTGHIATANSPVRAFFVQRLPHTGPIVRETAAALRRGHSTAPLAAAPEVNAGRAGTAVDYLLRFALAPAPCPRHASVHAGAEMLGAPMASSALEAVDEALAHVAEVAAYRRVPTDAQWDDLAEVSLVLATFESVYRSGVIPPPIARDVDKPPAGWRAWAQIICIEAEVEDIAMLGWAAASDHSRLRGRPLTCNPIFKQSRSLGGADADLITDDGLLIDLKSTSTNRVCSRIDLWQLCGYALADTDDEHAITSVGLSALRWRTQATWPLDELLEALAGATVDLGTLRRDFATLLDALSRARRENRERRRTLRMEALTDGEPSAPRQGFIRPRQP